MRKMLYLLVLAVFLGIPMTRPGMVRAAMWAGAEIGGNWGLSPKVEINGFNAGSAGFTGSVIGGATIGYDFINSGFGAYAWPDWMKYFSFATDITYNRLRLPSVSGVNTSLDVNGYAVAWTFLFMAHYGLFPDSIIPSGRVNPYIGVGPAIVWTGIDLRSYRLRTTNVALVVEPGIRWMCFPNVSIDTAFRYRYYTPSEDVNGVNVKFNPLNHFAFLVRASYHF
jgi:hypothetical protein